MPKKIPMRTCIGCGTSKPKKELIRIVLTDDGEILADRTGRANGRGAYLCDDPACLQKAIKRKAFSRAFRQQVPAEAVQQLIHRRVPVDRSKGRTDRRGRLFSRRGGQEQEGTPGTDRRGRAVQYGEKVYRQVYFL